MAIALTPTVDSTVDVVFALDPDVTAKNGARGWMLKSEALMQSGADVLTMRPMNVDERAESLDAGGTRQTGLLRARIGLVAVNGLRSQKARDQWLNNCPDFALLLLGCYVRDITIGADATGNQGVFFAIADEDEPSEESEEPGG